MALLKFLKRKEEGALPTMSMVEGSSLTKAQLREANKAVLGVEEKNREPSKRGKYNQYTAEERARIGKYAAVNGASNAATHFSTMVDAKVRSPAQ